jgi:hypothetical protein
VRAELVQVRLNPQLTPNVEQILNDVALADVHAALISGAPVEFQTMSQYRPSLNPVQPPGQPLTGKHEVTLTFTATVEAVHAEVMQVTRTVFQGRNLHTAVVRWDVPAGTYSGRGWTWRHVEFHDDRAAWWKTAQDPNQAS